jgi:hypothetical protein
VEKVEYRRYIYSVKSKLLRCGFSTAALIILLSSCVSFQSGEVDRWGEIPRSPDQNLSRIQQELVSGAERFLGARRLVVDGVRFNADCTGVVQAIYASAGIDLQSPLNRYSGNGVSRLNSYLSDLGLLYSSTQPVPGDLIFWDNSYDRNGDGRWNDQLTHVGMVVSVDPAGTVTYVHHNYRKGIVLAQMNLLRPDTVVDGEERINSAMRMRDGKSYPKWLSSHLYRELGQGWKIEGSG